MTCEFQPSQPQEQKRSVAIINQHVSIPGQTGYNLTVTIHKNDESLWTVGIVEDGARSERDAFFFDLRVDLQATVQTTLHNMRDNITAIRQRRAYEDMERLKKHERWYH